MPEDDEDLDVPFEPVDSKSDTFGADTPVTGKTKMLLISLKTK